MTSLLFIFISIQSNFNLDKQLDSVSYWYEEIKPSNKQLKLLEADWIDLQESEVWQDPFVEQEGTILGQLDYSNALAILQLPTLNEILPVNLGSSAANLNSAVAFVDGSSLPNSGGNTIIAGHRGYYGQTLFLNINQLKAGDLIYLYYSDQQFVYQVIGHRIIGPNDLEALQNRNGAGLTLLTCTPIPSFHDRLLIDANFVEINNIEYNSQTLNTINTENAEKKASSSLSYSLMEIDQEDSFPISDLITQSIQDNSVNPKLNSIIIVLPYVIGIMLIFDLFLIILLIRHILK